MIDLHAHVLPGVDDGPTDLESAVDVVRLAAAGGVDTIVATPHVSFEWNNSASRILDGVRDLEHALAQAGVAVRILPGAEIALSRAAGLSDAELRSLALGGGKWLLVEPPHTSGAVGVESLFAELRQRGHQILLAHVERCPAFMEDPEMLPRLVRSGMLASVTAGALVGRFGKPARRAAAEFIATGLVHNVASDAHNSGRRPPGLAQEIADAGFGAYVEWLTGGVPTAILRGTPVPAPPTPASSARRHRILRRRR